MSSRRDFLTTTISTMAGAAFLKPFGASASATYETKHEPLTIHQAIDKIQAGVPGAPFQDTVDTVKSGDASQILKGIVTTMFATDAVIEKTAALGANFIIAHEPTFYNHKDDTSWLDGDKVYTYKKELLAKHRIVVMRFHDGWHSVRPDGVRMGVLKAMGWDKYYNEGQPEIISIPTTSAKEVIRLAKKSLGIEKMKFIGDLNADCQRIVVSPGAPGGRDQMHNLRKFEPDLMICGELNEWETAEYMRDARYQGMKMSLLVLGHSVSEEPGMEHLVPWLEARLPGVPVKHIVSEDPFTWV